MCVHAVAEQAARTDNLVGELLEAAADASDLIVCLRYRYVARNS
jgi:hypothetical protein